MQKLNGREIYVLVLLALIAIILSSLFVRDISSESSSLQRTADGALTISQNNIVNLGTALFQIVLCVVAFVFMILKRAAGWIAAVPLLLFYWLLAVYLLVASVSAGFWDLSLLLGAAMSLAPLLGLIFLFIPSTVKKFKVRWWAIAPLAVITFILFSLLFWVPK